MTERLACPVCGVPLSLYCNHLRSIGLRSGEVAHIRLEPDGRKVLRKDIPLFRVAVAANYPSAAKAFAYVEMDV